MIIKISNTLILVILLCFYFNSSKLLSQDYNFGLGIMSSYITSFDLFNTPKSYDLYERNQYQTISTLYSFSFEFRVLIFDNPIYLIFNIESIRKNFNQNSLKALVNSFPQNVKTEETFELIPIETNVTYILPFSSAKIKFYFGGGAGVYIGNYSSKIGDIESITLSKDIDYGIVVNLGLEYYFYKNFSLKSEMKFREPDFLIEASYEKSSFNIGKDKVTLFEQKFSKKINFNGISFSFGIFFNF